MSRNYTKQNSSQHKCPNCGAPLRFDPQSGSLFCDHCESAVTFDQSADVREREFDELVTFQTIENGAVTCYRCENCGAVSVAPRTALATKCPYCGSPVVIDDATGSLVKPDTVIPFELTPAQAAAQLSAWRRRKFYAPHKFRKQIKEDVMRGVFLPVWTFDAETSSDYDGDVGYHRTRTVHRDGKVHTETYTEWRRVKGTLQKSFDDITVRANENVPYGYFEKLKPFPKFKYRVYNDEYLAGYIADHYTLEPLAAYRQAKEIMQKAIRRAILQKYNADEEGTIKLNMHVLKKSFKYLLVPVYVASTKYRDKIYNQYVSGVFYDAKNSVSRISGKSPVSVWKVVLTVLAGVGLLGLLGWLMLRANSFDVDPDVWAHALGLLQKMTV